VVGLLCAGTLDTDCEGKIREETLTGTDLSSLVSVDVSDSVENRLAKALIYLNTTFPAEGWDIYVPSGVVQWNLIRLSGHSQGGGLAAYAATQHPVDRVCAFSSPADWNPAVNAGLGGPAPWLSATSATPSGSYYGFGHQQDPIVLWVRLQQIWAALSMAGPTANVDSVASPYSSSHMLYSNLASTGSYHSMPVGDSVTPLDSSGVPTYLPVWQYACFQ